VHSLISVDVKNMSMNTMVIPADLSLETFFYAIKDLANPCMQWFPSQNHKSVFWCFIQSGRIMRCLRGEPQYC